MWKSGNCIFAREGTSKSSFLGSVFHANSSFFDTCFRNLWLPPLTEGIIHIILNLWTHLASHLRPKFVIFCTSFFVWFFHPRSISKVKSRWGICDTKGVRGELGGIHRRFSPLAWATRTIFRIVRLCSWKRLEDESHHRYIKNAICYHAIYFLMCHQIWRRVAPKTPKDVHKMPNWRHKVPKSSQTS